MARFLKRYDTYSDYQSAGNDDYVREIVPGVALVKDRYDLGTEPNVFYNAPEGEAPRYMYDLVPEDTGYWLFYADTYDTESPNYPRWEEASSEILPLVQANLEGTVTPFLIDIYVEGSPLTTLDETCNITYTSDRFYSVQKNVGESGNAFWVFEAGNESSLSVGYREGGV